MNLIPLLARYRVLSALDLLSLRCYKFFHANFWSPGAQFLGVNLILNFSNFGDLGQRSLENVGTGRTDASVDFSGAPGDASRGGTAFENSPEAGTQSEQEHRTGNDNGFHFDLPVAPKQKTPAFRRA